MAEPPVYQQGLNEPDSAAYKGRRAEQDAAATAPLAPPPIGKVLDPAQQHPSGQDWLGPVQNPVEQQPPWQGPVYDPHAQTVAGHGYDPTTAAMGAVYAPGSGAGVDGVWVPGPQEASLPSSYLSPGGGVTSVASLGDGNGVGEHGPLGGDQYGGHAPFGMRDDVSFQHADIAAALSGEPPATPARATGPTLVDTPSAPPGYVPTGQSGEDGWVGTVGSGLGPGTASGTGGDGAPPAGAEAIQVWVDGHVVSSGNDAVAVDVGRDGAAHLVGGLAGSGPETGGQQQPVPGQHGQQGHGQQGQPGTGDPAADSRFIHGEGSDPAHVELTVDRASLGNVPVHVVKNPDGSVDVKVPRAGPDGHDVGVHVAHGQNVDISLTRDAHGNITVRARQDTDGDNRTGQSGLSGPAGAHSGDGSGTDSTDPNSDPAGGSQHEVPGGGGPPGGGPPGGGGGMPTGGGGGMPPGGGGPLGQGPPAGGYPPSNTGGTRNGGGDGTVRADPETIKKLGADLTDRAGPILDRAHQKAGSISVGFPAFGVLGLPLNMAHEQVKNHAQSYLAAGRNQLDTWRTTLNQTANNWQNAEDSSTVQNG